MCLSIHVDPLTSNKGFWADILGIGNYYFELAVRIVQVSVETRLMNGGIIALKDLTNKLNSSGVKDSLGISEEDVKRGVLKLGCLGNGYKLIEVSSTTFLSLYLSCH